MFSNIYIWFEKGSFFVAQKPPPLILLNGSTQVVRNFNICGEKKLELCGFRVTFILLRRKKTFILLKWKKADGKSVVQSYLHVRNWWLSHITSWQSVKLSRGKTQELNYENKLIFVLFGDSL